MMGWGIFIHNELSDSKNMSDWRLPKKENILAKWGGGISGDKWLEKLVAADKAKCLGGCGYPIRYLAKVKDVLPLIQFGLPNHSPSSWVSEATINLEMFNLEDPERVIVIDTWDES